jgi:hypothetical protein
MRTWHLAKEAGLHGAVDVHGALEPRLVPRLLAHLQPDETEHASIITAVKRSTQCRCSDTINTFPIMELKFTGSG